MKKAVIVLTALVCVIPLIFALIPDKALSKEEIIAAVTQYQTVLREDIAQNGFERTEGLIGVYRIDVTDDVVDFACSSGNGGYYTGFFYTADDDVAALWCAGPADELVPDGAGYTYTTDEYRYYAEPICENFYYYEAQF